MESSKFKEYERLEGDGYDENIKDEDHAKVKTRLFINEFLCKSDVAPPCGRN